MNTRQVIIVVGAAVLACVAPFTEPSTASAQVRRLDLERYKAAIKVLAQFGDRRQASDRNRAAVEWILRELASYGCTVERLHYTYNRPAEP
jgi:hypothetical protein